MRLSRVTAWALSPQPILLALAKRGGIRELGDGNMGAANAWRELGPKAGIAVAIADVGKGAAAMLIAYSIALPCLVGFHPFSHHQTYACRR